MPPIQRKTVPTKKVVPTKVVEDEEDDEELEEGEEDTPAVAPVKKSKPAPVVEEDEEDEESDEELDEEADEEGNSEEAEAEDIEGLPEITEPIAEVNVGFDYFAKVHEDLKAAGYVANQGATKALIKYFNQMMFFNALENGRHDIPGLGTIFSDIKPEKEMVSTGFGGKEKGEKYTVAAKHFFGFKMSGAAKTKLAEISELDGWEPNHVLALINAGAEDEE